MQLHCFRQTPDPHSLPSPTRTHSVLNDLGLSGAIPAAGFPPLPTTTAWLQLSNNSLHGSLPPDLRLPPSLNTLWLAFNQLSGELPQELQLPPPLVACYLDNNRFTGAVRPWHLPGGLEQLGLCGQQLSGSLPADWDLPPRLNLYLQGNTLSGVCACVGRLKAEMRVGVGQGRVGGVLRGGVRMPSHVQIGGGRGPGLDCSTNVVDCTTRTTASLGRPAAHLALLCREQRHRSAAEGLRVLRTGGSGPSAASPHQLPAACSCEAAHSSGHGQLAGLPCTSPRAAAGAQRPALLHQ